jgi:hypothetical protein
MVSSGMSDRFDDRITALCPLTVYYKGDNMLMRDMSCEHLCNIQTILDDWMFLRLFLLLLHPLLLVLFLSILLGSFDAGRPVGA